MLLTQHSTNSKGPLEKNWRNLSTTQCNIYTQIMISDKILENVLILIDIREKKSRHMI